MNSNFWCVQRGPPMKRIFEIAILVLLFDLFCFYAFASGEITGTQAISKSCQILDAGPTERGWKNLRIAQDDKILVGADSVVEAVADLEHLKKDGQCTIQAQNCGLHAEGYAQGSWHRSVLMVGDQAVAGANDLGKLLTQFKQLKEKGICE